MSITTPVFANLRIGVVVISQLTATFTVLGEFFFEVIGSITDLAELTSDVNVGFETARV